MLYEQFDDHIVIVLTKGIHSEVDTDGQSER